MGVSKKIDTAVGMGAAVTFVMGLASAVCYLVNKSVLDPIWVLASCRPWPSFWSSPRLVQFVEMFLQKTMPTLYTALGVYLPLITTNCAVLGVAAAEHCRTATTSSLPWSMASPAVWASCWPSSCSPAVREQLDVSSECPKAFEGFPIALVTAGLMALAFMGFSGLKVW